MIDYRQLETGIASDVEAITDDNDAEMAALDAMVQECEFDIQLPDERDEDGNFRFTIPAEMVGEFAECAFEIDNGKLDDLIAQWNEDIISEDDE